jgi:ribosomal protein S12 methylthiotransferase accessory factor
MPIATRVGITRVANITGLDVLGIPVWIACRPNSRSLAVSQGKGADDACARVSAVMESIEAHHAERITLPVKFASSADLRRGHRLADLDRLARTAAPLHPETPIFWIEARELSTGDGVWVPLELVHLNHTLPQWPGTGLFVSSSNGLASGNHELEAIGHALTELIERDATTLWALSGPAGVARTRLDLATIEDGAVCELLARFDRAGVGVAVWDTTSDVGVSSFTCAIAEADPNPMRPLPIARGMGCHPAREVALHRALTEAAQSRLTVISGSRDDLGDVRDAYGQDAAEYERQRRVICDEVGARDFRAVPTFEGANLDDDVAVELAALRAAGLGEPLVVDLSQPEHGIPVVRAIVPGLEALHHAPGYTPGERARARRGMLS